MNDFNLLNEYLAHNKAPDMILDLFLIAKQIGYKYGLNKFLFIPESFYILVRSFYIFKQRDRAVYCSYCI